MIDGQRQKHAADWDSTRLRCIPRSGLLFVTISHPHRVTPAAQVSPLLALLARVKTVCVCMLFDVRAGPVSQGHRRAETIFLEVTRCGDVWRAKKGDLR